MRSTLRDILPSMFHRRLLLLTGTMLLVVGVLGTATSMLATGESHKQAREIAESNLRSQRMIQTMRGAILDRNGVVLAEDEQGWELAVHFDLLTGKWAYKRAFADASKDKLAWGEMGQDERERRIAKLEGDYAAMARSMFTTMAQLSGVDQEELDSRRLKTVERVKRLQTYLWEAWRKKEKAQRDGEDVPLEQVAEPIRDELQHHVLLPDLNDQQARLIQTFIDEGDRAKEGNVAARSALPWTMVELRRTTVRRYHKGIQVVELDQSTLPGPLAKEGTVKIEVAVGAVHLVGLMRDVWEPDIEAHPLRDMKGRYFLTGYKDGDRRGRSGVEAAMEKQLRGSRGMRTVSLDTGEELSSVPPNAGRDVRLTIDIELQARIQAVMSPEFGLMKMLPWHMKVDDPPELLDMPLQGGAVVMDIATGDVLAAVTTPEVPRDDLAKFPDDYWRNPIYQPMVNRALARPYQPGSTLKPLVLAAAIYDGLLGENEVIDTPGFLWPDKPEVYRDWYWKMYALLRGEIDGPTAIEVSSNPFFGILTERMIKRFGRDRLPTWYRRFGLGVKPGTGLPEETAGFLGVRGRELEHNEVCFMAIGQGPVSWTPLQAATAYTRLASGDMSRQARLIASPQVVKHPVVELDRLPDNAVRLALEGMRRSASSNDGTTHHISHPPSGLRRVPIFNVQGVTVMAKSGTADPGPYRWVDLNLNEKMDKGEVERNPRDHAWVIAVVQPDGASKPTHVVACVVEYAGSGGRVAGPVVNQIIHALQHQGYLNKSKKAPPKP